MEAVQGRFLVVDDEAVIRQSYGRVLSEAGHHVESADSGRSALEALRSGHFDGLFADLKMPDMSGLEVTRLAKELRPGLPVVIITGYPSSEASREADELGVLMLQSKPVTPDALIGIAERTLDASRLQAVEVAAEAPVEAVAEALDVAPADHELEVAAVSANPQTRDSIPKMLFKLASAPIVGGAFVMLMPFVGFFVLGALLLKAAGLKTGLLGE